MAKRLYKTTADYLAIAISPALVMALVGSLVFFLIEVAYVGQYQWRLNYAFALFVFAAVLIARISIEMGSERAALFALPLAIAMFLFLVRFVEHPSGFSHVINLALMTVVWWCAHRLTWDSTVIDDDEDASGEGLMQRIGVDGPERADGDKETQGVPSAGTRENELFEERESVNLRAVQRFKQLFRARKGPHTPGLWVLYFSLAALPLFGIGQHWIPVAEVGRRRYVFVLLLVYVAAALALLVTTSFLNLRRYLRQRRVEMPLPIAGTWVGVGAVLIVVVMMLSLLIPRPGAEVALSRVPWQAGSPTGLSASRTSVNRDGGEEPGEQTRTTAGDSPADQGQGNLPPNGKKAADQGAPHDSNDKARSEGSKNGSDSADGVKSTKKTDRHRANSSGTTTRNAEKSAGKATDTGKPGERNNANQNPSDNSRQAQTNSPTEKIENEPKSREQPGAIRQPSTPPSAHPLEAIRNLSSPLGGVTGVLKVLFYIIAALFVGYCIWIYRHQLMQALADILRQLRQLFGGARTVDGKNDAETTSAGSRARRFTDFRDPFLAGEHGRLSPEELVRYTFAAFEAWANDRGRPRTPDCTPQELIRMAVEPETPLYAEARQLARMYSELAYASRRVPREAADNLRELWALLRNTHTAEFV